MASSEQTTALPARLRQHELKIWPEYFGPVFDGSKTFEIRKNDRGFQVGDELWLREWEVGPDRLGHTGRECWRIITYVLGGDHWLLFPGYVVLGLRESKAEALASSGVRRGSDEQKTADSSRDTQPGSHADGSTPVVTAEMLERARNFRAMFRPVPLTEAEKLPDPDYDL